MDGTYTEHFGITYSLIDSYRGRAESYLALNQLDRALADADKAVSLGAANERRRSAAYRTRAEIQRARGDRASARDDAWAALETAKRDEDREDAQAILRELDEE